MAAKLTTIATIAAAGVLLLILVSAADAGIADGVQSPWTTSVSPCSGTIAECMAAGEFDELDSESNRRILATSNYISYGAMQRNKTPCSRRGSSYYNCKPGSSSNPYSRSCSTATRCRS